MRRDALGGELDPRAVAGALDPHAGEARAYVPYIKGASGRAWLDSLATVLRYLEIGKREGRLLCGGERLGGDLARGYFVAPTIFADVRPEHRIAQEEIFGPVLSVLAVADFDEAITVTNGARYGLSSSIYTRDVNRVFRYLDRVETGILHINSATVGGEAQVMPLINVGAYAAAGYRRRPRHRLRRRRRRRRARRSPDQRGSPDRHRWSARGRRCPAGRAGSG